MNIQELFITYRINEDTFSFKENRRKSYFYKMIDLQVSFTLREFNLKFCRARPTSGRQTPFESNLRSLSTHASFSMLKDKIY